MLLSPTFACWPVCIRAASLELVEPAADAVHRAAEGVVQLPRVAVVVAVGEQEMLGSAVPLEPPEALRRDHRVDQHALGGEVVRADLAADALPKRLPVPETGGDLLQGVSVPRRSAHAQSCPTSRPSLGWRPSVPGMASARRILGSSTRPTLAGKIEFAHPTGFYVGRVPRRLSSGPSARATQLCWLERPRVSAPARARRSLSGSCKGRDGMRKTVRRLLERLRAAVGLDRLGVGVRGVRSATRDA